MALEQKCCTGEQRVGMEVEALKAKAWDHKEGSGMVNWNQDQGQLQVIEGTEHWHLGKITS